MKIVVVEDEKYTAQDLIRTLGRIDNSLEVVEVVSSVEEGIAYFSQRPKVDLVFSDIQLGDGLSFEIYDNFHLEFPIIYCTAYDEFALKAFKTLGIDYILKPFTEKTVKKALDKFSIIKGENHKSNEDTSKLLEFLKQQLKPEPKSILIKKADKILPLAVENIALFFIEHESVFAYTFDQQKRLVNEKLNMLEASFSESFFRTSRQYLVNRAAIKDASQYFNRKLKITLNLDFSEEIIVGKLKVTSFLDWLAKS